MERQPPVPARVSVGRARPLSFEGSMGWEDVGLDCPTASALERERAKA